MGAGDFKSKVGNGSGRSLLLKPTGHWVVEKEVSIVVIRAGMDAIRAGIGAIKASANAIRKNTFAIRKA